ncbi:MAG: hypothetical protein ACRCV0_03835 [Brevinema sp.]
MMLAPYLFSYSAHLPFSQQKLEKYRALVNALQQKSQYTLTIYYDDDLIFTFQNQEQKITSSMSSQRAFYWSDQFHQATKMASIYDSLNVNDQREELLLRFLEEMGISFPQEFFILNVIYQGRYFYVPFEFLSGKVLPKHIFCCLDTITQQSIHSQERLKFAMMFDPDLATSYPESLKVLKLLEIKDFSFDQQYPDIILVSAHGAIDEKSNFLENKSLEEIIKNISLPKIIIFNCCLLAQKHEGIIKYFTDQGTDVIASPFYTLADKTIFPALLRFFIPNGNMFEIFAVAGIFYPRLFRYFRYITTKTPF